jgi:hypothetical protein
MVIAPTIVVVNVDMTPPVVAGHPEAGETKHNARQDNGQMSRCDSRSFISTTLRLVSWYWGSVVENAAMWSMLAFVVLGAVDDHGCDFHLPPLT